MGGFYYIGVWGGFFFFFWGGGGCAVLLTSCYHGGSIAFKYISVDLMTD